MIAQVAMMWLALLLVLFSFRTRAESACEREMGYGTGNLSEVCTTIKCSEGE